jgi:hypothetical protein
MAKATFKPTPAEVKAAKDLGLPAPTTAAIEASDKQTEDALANQGTGFVSGGVLGSGFSLPAVASSGTSKTPGVQVPKDLANVELDFANPNQYDYSIKGGTKTAGGATRMTYAQIVAAFRALPEAQRQDIQRNLYEGGFYPSGHVAKIDGTFTAADMTALQQAALQAYNGGTSLMTLLIHGGQAGSFESQLLAYQRDIQQEEGNAQRATAPPVSLTDPNQVRQAFATAMEAMGAGVPSQAMADAFVSRFHDAEISAVQNLGEAEKQGLLSAIPSQEAAMRDLLAGNAAGATTAAAQPGPVTVATKSMPNLDAEARAQAEADNPAAYYSNQMSLLGGIIHNALNGTDTFQTRPEAPSQTAPVGGMLGTPFQGM